MLYYRGISCVSLNVEFVLFYSHIHFLNRKSGWSKFLGHLGIEKKSLKSTIYASGRTMHGNA